MSHYRGGMPEWRGENLNARKNETFEERQVRVRKEYGDYVRRRHEYLFGTGRRRWSAEASPRLQAFSGQPVPDDGAFKPVVINTQPRRSSIATVMKPTYAAAPLQNASIAQQKAAEVQPKPSIPVGSSADSRAPGVSTKEAPKDVIEPSVTSVVPNDLCEESTVCTEFLPNSPSDGVEASAPVDEFQVDTSPDGVEAEVGASVDGLHLDNPSDDMEADGPSNLNLPDGEEAGDPEDEEYSVLSPEAVVPEAGDPVDDLRSGTSPDNVEIDAPVDEFRLDTSSHREEAMVSEDEYHSDTFPEKIDTMTFEDEFQSRASPNHLEDMPNSSTPTDALLTALQPLWPILNILASVAPSWNSLKHAADLIVEFLLALVYLISSAGVTATAPLHDWFADLGAQWSLLERDATDALPGSSCKDISGDLFVFRAPLKSPSADDELKPAVEDDVEADRGSTAEIVWPELVYAEIPQMFDIFYEFFGTVVMGFLRFALEHLVIVFDRVLGMF